EDGLFALLYDRVINFDVGYYSEPGIDPYREDSWDSTERESLPYAIEVRLDIELNPRRSLESLGILGTNRARIEFEDFLTIPETTRWVFRHRLHPTLPGPGSQGNGLPSDGAKDPATEGGPGGIGGFGGGDRPAGTGRDFGGGTSGGKKP
ncbi:MAG: hypothetical protein QF524_05820, partial [Planctomycetota bacterium]|nr:hypothetical protein [Planctomycetota bacterium]